MSLFDYLKDLKGLVVSTFWDVLTNLKNFYNTIYVVNVYDLPYPENRNIRLADNKTYCFVTMVDLEGNYITAGQNTVILGYSSENCGITSALQPGESLINSEWSLPIRFIELSVSGANTTILNLDAGANANQALDWFGVNFNGGSIGTIANYTNFIMSDSAVLSGSDGFVFDGSIGTIGFNTCLFTGFSGSGTYITLPSTLTVTRRFRVGFTSFVCGSGVIGIDVNSSTTIPNEGYILFVTNFSGASASYLSGVNYSNDKALFLFNRGINNTSVIAQYYMQNNATATTITTPGTYYKIAGTTTANTAINQKFTHADNKLTYTGSLTRNFKVTASISASSANNQNLKFRIAKNGTSDITSQSRQDTAGSGRVDNVVCQWLGTLVTNDYIEIFCTNDTSASNITVEDINVIIEEV